MKKKTALVTGAAGMDGSHLADMLLEHGYHVVGMIRRNATRDLGNISHLEHEPDLDIVEGDITDMSSVMRIMQTVRPHEIYNMAAQSHVHTSFEQPLATLDIDTKGLVNVLEAVLALGRRSRVFHASTSEMFGASPPPQSMETVLQPQSPYAIAKVASHHFIRLYRQSYSMYACAGVTFNHEGPRRGPMFVTRKVTMGVAQALKNPDFKLKLGNLDAERDWGYAPDFVRGFWMALQQENPDDYIFATGESHSVRELCEAAFSVAGLDYQDHVEVDRFFMRPSEVDALCGDYSETERKIGWRPQVRFKELVQLMVESDCRLLGVEDRLPSAEEKE